MPSYTTRFSTSTETICSFWFPVSSTHLLTIATIVVDSLSCYLLIAPYNQTKAVDADHVLVTHYSYTVVS